MNEFKYHPQCPDAKAFTKREINIRIFSNGDIAAFENGKQLAEIQAINVDDILRDKIEQMGFLVNRIEYQQRK